ncbi:MAG: hypothetical protein CW338_03935 [Clostridiales bacterium]|nr:hypothetical protein [Clostridiales bacterium]
MSMRRKIAVFLLMILLVSALPAVSLAADGKAPEGDITANCTLEVSCDRDHRNAMTKEGYASYWTGKPGASVTVKVKNGKQAGGAAFSFHSVPGPLRVEDAATGEILGEYTGVYENGSILFTAPSSAFRIINASETEEVEVSKLQIIAEGEIPGWVQRWRVMEGDADMMLVSTHPDDELLWFGGMLPYYAGELKKKVIVVYMVGGNSPKRKNELLDGLWACGVRDYPDIGYFPDKGASSYNSTIRNWGEGAAQLRVTQMIRKYRPAVVVTQDIKGEYGHFHHIVTVEAVISAVTELAADPAYDPDSAAEHGTFAPSKLYLHLYKQNVITFDWRQPLSAFNGETGLSVAKRAFKMHISQQTGKYHVNDSGKLDCRLFGLYWSSVGEDAEHNDLFENIPASPDQTAPQ